MHSYFLFINKPTGITSQKVLTPIKKSLPRKTKVGHNGTLDPFASGLMLVGVGEACKFFRFVDDSQKTYVATLKLGEATDTLDSEGEITQTAPIPDGMTKQSMTKVLQSFLGKQEQIPPMYSAIKIDGQPLYKKARQGEEVERKPRPIEIFDISLLLYDEGQVEFEVTCSRGTYVRVLAQDIAIKLGTVGHLVGLKRTRLNGIDSYDEGHVGKPLPMESLLKHLPRLDLTEEQARDLRHGKKVRIDVAGPQNEPIVLLENDKMIGIGRLKGDQLESERL